MRSRLKGCCFGLMLKTGLVCPAPQTACGVFVCERAWLTKLPGSYSAVSPRLLGFYSLYFKEMLQMLDSGSESSDLGTPGA